MRLVRMAVGWKMHATKLRLIYGLTVAGIKAVTFRKIKGRYHHDQSP